jgi:hypothetical protein
MRRRGKGGFSGGNMAGWFGERVDGMVWDGMACNDYGVGLYRVHPSPRGLEPAMSLLGRLT